MNLTEVKEKLEFNLIIERVQSLLTSELGLSSCSKLEFITDPEILSRELDKTSEAKALIIEDGVLDLGGIKDIAPALEKLKIDGNYVLSEQYLHILKFLKAGRAVKNYLAAKVKDAEDKKYGLLYELSKPIFFDRVLEHNIEITIDENGTVKDSASSELRKIRQELLSKKDKLRKTLAKILRNVSEKEYSQDDIITQRDGRFVIPVKAENKRNVPGIIHSTSSSGATVFVEPGETIEFNNDITELQFKEKREIEKILIELSKQISRYYKELKINYDILCEIDFIFAKARYAIECIAIKPFITEKSTELINAYHPVLLITHNRKDVVPLTLSIGDEYNTLIVTGPNAGGKTVALKTAGVLQLMLQHGFLIPAADNTKMRIYNKIFVNIGDEQSLENDLSTFSSHLQALKHIIDNCDSSSLILIDEICSGTDPNLGSALAASILLYFTKKESVTIATTHIGELKEFAYNTPYIENASLEFNYKTLSPSFNFITGVPGQSFTFEIAEKFDYPIDLIHDAKSRVDVSEAQLEDLIKELNANKQKYSELKKSTDIENSRLKGLVNLYEKKNKELEENEKKLLNEAKLEAKSILAEANRLIERTIKEIREKKDFSPKMLKQEYNESVSKLTLIEDIPEEIKHQDISEGDFVKLKNSTTSGEVIEINGNALVINANGLSIKTKLSEVERISAKQHKSSHNESTIKVNDGPIPNELDLRGVYPSDAEAKIDEFIHNSYLFGLHSIQIIHGKGTGKLRDAVKSALRKNPKVISSRLGNWNEGDTGVTIVEI